MNAYGIGLPTSVGSLASMSESLAADMEGVSRRRMVGRVEVWEWARRLQEIAEALHDLAKKEQGTG